MPIKDSRHVGSSRIEILIVTGMIAVMIALLLPAVENVTEDSNRDSIVQLSVPISHHELPTTERNRSHTGTARL
jgi:hypothetical protein